MSRGIKGGMVEKNRQLQPLWRAGTGETSANSAHFVAVCAAVSTRAATGFAQARREYGSDLLLRENCELSLSMP